MLVSPANAGILFVIDKKNVTKKSAKRRRVERRKDFLTHLRRLHQEMRNARSTGFTAEGWKVISDAIAGER
jgi:hypothetical protein